MVRNKDPFIVRLTWVDGLTLCGLVLASLAACLALHGQFAFALSLLFVAMIADAFDGILARKFGMERDFGRYLDGFIDVYDYLAVPALFLYLWGFNTWYYGAVLILFMMCGVVRLSHFNEIGNVQNEEDELSYLGMPVFWSILLLGGLYAVSWLIPPKFLFPPAAVLFTAFAVLMLCNRPFHKFKNPRRILAVLAGASLLFALKGLADLPGPLLPQGAAGVQGDGSFLSPENFLTAFLFLLPAIVGGILHMLAVTRDWLPFLKIPVFEPWFGANKTLRGFLLMPLLAVPGAWLAHLLAQGRTLTVDLAGTSFLTLGLLLGFAYVLFELPNSFLKRRLGIVPGAEAHRLRVLFIFLDQMDSAVGVALAAVLFFGAPLETAAAMLLMSPLIALTIKRLLYLTGLKKSSV
jgi:phosphatidylserine synthase